jgi:hypothetical protein
MTLGDGAPSFSAMAGFFGGQQQTQQQRRLPTESLTPDDFPALSLGGAQRGGSRTTAQTPQDDETLGLGSLGLGSSRLPMQQQQQNVKNLGFGGGATGGGGGPRMGFVSSLSSGSSASSMAPGMMAPSKGIQGISASGASVTAGLGFGPQSARLAALGDFGSPAPQQGLLSGQGQQQGLGLGSTGFASGISSSSSSGLGSGLGPGLASGLASGLTSGLGGVGQGGLGQSLGHAPGPVKGSTPTTGPSSNALTNGSSASASAAASLMDDKYGLRGLIDVIRMTSEDLSTLALGACFVCFFMSYLGGHTHS